LEKVAVASHLEWPILIGMEASERLGLLRKAVHLEYLSIAASVIEGGASIAAGVMAGSVALTGFGIDSFIETLSAVLVFRRLRHELDGANAEDSEERERKTARLAGILMLLLALYIVVDGGRRLLGYGPKAEDSTLGIAIAAISAAVMPSIGIAKLRIARALNSASLRVDAYESITCASLAVTTLIGLVLNHWLHWWWADPVAGLFLLPLIIREGLEGLRGGCHCQHAHE